MSNKITIAELAEQTATHQEDVVYLFQEVQMEIGERAPQHDYTKNTKQALTTLAGCINGKLPWSEWKSLHFKQERHHPEFHTDLTDMTLMDLTEMVLDGVSACFRRSDTPPIMEEQVAHYFTKGFDVSLSTLLAKEFMKYYVILSKSVEEQGS